MRKVIVLLAAGLLMGAFGASAVEAKKSPPPVPLAVVGVNPTTSSLDTDVATTTTTFTAGPTLTLAAGTWLLWGHVRTNNANSTCRLTDGTTIVASDNPNGGYVATVSGFLVVASSATVRVECKASGVAGTMQALANGEPMASYLTAFKTA